MNVLSSTYMIYAIGKWFGVMISVDNAEKPIAGEITPKSLSLR